jgi:hypothetical protein
LKKKVIRPERESIHSEERLEQSVDPELIPDAKK